eukprot:TRINITY_DN7602_c0_g1_i2.p1 TRINITY_DN7602_c0_g1~~TRINITY_DN7602_c0_g1_i2.p1  ORF type:complete len:125 (-),score=20.24 TRINITY_DN7602_c0_g1_i2:67-441(-)
MEMTRACCNTEPAKSNYKPVGDMIHLGDLPVYVVGPADSKIGLIGALDIFGFHPNTQQFCDIVSKATNARVFLPDFFRGNPWSTVPIDPKELIPWLQEHVPDQVVTADILAGPIHHHLRAQGNL